jgi:anti-sigma regulatory factor (Ser/Thr protein kinase)
MRELCECAVSEALERGLPEERGDRLRLAVEEGAVNVCRYAYRGGEGDIELSVSEEGGLIVVQLADEGAPFDPLSVEKPDVARSIREGKAGGLGIHLMKSIAGGVSYRREGTRNILRLAFARAGGGDDETR